LRKHAILTLADGTKFEGLSIGAAGVAVGEVVFNTAMTGYQEILTDPSYAQQIVTLTVPHVGNTGVNAFDEESANVHAAGLIIRDAPLQTSSFRSEQTLSGYLQAHGTVAIAGIDTRRLTRHLREHGAQPGVIDCAGDANTESAADAIAGFGSLVGRDLAREVSVQQSYEWSEGTWNLGDQFARPANTDLYVVAYDFGVKRNILRMLVDQGCRVTVVNAQTPAADVLAMNPDGVFLSNGPGDPEPCDYAIAAIRELLEKRIPMFGICLGHQLLALASGASTVKMKFGHHGANHPVVDLDTRRVMISSQNHGFAVDEDTLPSTLRATHRSLFDQTLQGIEHTGAPAFSFQGHPEASPGPHDVAPLFERFIALIKKHNNA
jgi:carbamoyl-phosphate synthase small subunit